jgi:ketosteroid isomerase-like protein
MTTHKFDEFMAVRGSAAEAYVNGDPGPLGHVVARSSSATFFGPKGGCVQGAEEVASGYRRDAQHFGKGGESTLEILQKGASDDVAYWVGIQRAMVRMEGKMELIPFNLRVTEIFRREGNEWKLVHRHADPLKPDVEGK